MPRKPKPHPETCPKCPHRYSEHGCPFYMTGREGLMESKPSLQGMPETRVITGCIWYEGHLMRWIAHGVAAMERPAATLQGWRNDSMEKLGQLTQRITFAEVFKALAPNLGPGINAIELDRSRLAKDVTDLEAGDATNKVGE